MVKQMSLKESSTFCCIFVLKGCHVNYQIILLDNTLNT